MPTINRWLTGKELFDYCPLTEKGRTAVDCLVSKKNKQEGWEEGKRSGVWGRVDDGCVAHERVEVGGRCGEVRMSARGESVGVGQEEEERDKCNIKHGGIGSGCAERTYDSQVDVQEDEEHEGPEHDYEGVRIRIIEEVYEQIAEFERRVF
eukprot:GHVQ01040015.1.p1 GENE.GHVQ01040015.1~~GHVQ01040015.1.p1  ORF type:complete len:151 (+),score=46.69 GHVQ01040015.1:481-933(+)